MNDLTELLLTVLCILSTADARARRVLASPDIPITSFSCAGRPIGYYADVETDCRVYHMCGERGQQYSYKCPDTTLFQQRMLVCAHWYQVNCSRTLENYGANLLIGQRDKPFVEDIVNGDLNSVQPGDKLQTLATERPREAKSFLTNRRSDQVSPSSATTASDLQLSPSGRVFPRNRLSKNNKPIVNSVTEPTASQFRPTNLSFRSTIETPNSETTLAQTAPMSRVLPLSRTESVFKTRPESVTSAPPAVQAHRPSSELEPPLLDTTIEETNTIELHLHDPRRELFIPSSKSGNAASDFPPESDEPIVVSINFRGNKSRFSHASVKERGSVSSVCPRCHPSFLIDKINCSPCLIVN